jgi:hypothetical protein
MSVDPMSAPGRRLEEARKLKRAKLLYWLRKIRREEVRAS